MCFFTSFLPFLHHSSLSVPQSIKRVQSDYEKRLKDVESQREQLLSEMESRESTLIAKVCMYIHDVRLKHLPLYFLE